MKRRNLGVLALVAASATMATGVAMVPAAFASPAGDTPDSPSAAQRLDNRPGPLTDRQNERRKAAQKLILSGQASPSDEGVVQLGVDKYYEASVTGTGRLFTILSEFGDQTSGKLGSTPGPLHNEIPEPDRAVLTGEVGEELIRNLKGGVRELYGWLDDDLAFTTDWGFSLTDIRVPTYVWQGSTDLMVPFHHGEWLAANIPGAVAHLEPGEGHLSIEVRNFDRMVDELATHLRRQ